MSRFTDWWRRQIGTYKDQGPEAEEIKALTDQFYVALNAYLSGVDDSQFPSDNKALLRVRQLAGVPEDERTWQDAYDLEQQLVLLFDESTLETELSRRLVEARHSMPTAVTNWYVKAVETADSEPKRRAILVRLVNDIQWRYTKAEARRGYTKQITGRTELIFTLAVLLFASALLTVIVFNQRIGLDHILLLFFVVSSGAFGAAFSMMISLKGRLANSTFDDLKLNRSWGLISARILVGIGASMVLYFFVASGLLSGEAFFQLTRETKGSETILAKMSEGNFAKLFIWSFIAGFSEKLIPNLLSSTESRASDQSTLPPQELGGPNPPPRGESGAPKGNDGNKKP